VGERVALGAGERLAPTMAAIGGVDRLTAMITTRLGGVVDRSWWRSRSTLLLRSQGHDLTKSMS